MDCIHFKYIDGWTYIETFAIASLLHHDGVTIGRPIVVH